MNKPFGLLQPLSVAERAGQNMAFFFLLGKCQDFRDVHGCSHWNFVLHVFRFWKKMDNINKFGFWFPGCCCLGFVMLDFRDVQNRQILKCNFLSENNTASSFLIIKWKIKYKWHHQPCTDDKPFCGRFYPLFALIRNLQIGSWDPAGSWLYRHACQQTHVSSFSYLVWEHLGDF